MEPQHSGDRGTSGIAAEHTPNETVREERGEQRKMKREPRGQEGR